MYGRMKETLYDKKYDGRNKRSFSTLRYALKHGNMQSTRNDNLTDLLT